MDKYIKQIKELIKAEQYKAAHQLCIQIINADPENSKAFKLKQKIEKLVEKQNIKAIENDLKKLNPLWKENKYEELITNLQKLHTFAPHYQKIKDLISKAQNDQQQYQIKQADAYIKQTLNQMQELVKENKFIEAINSEHLLQPYLNYKPQIKEQFIKIRRAYIDHQLKNKKELLQSDKNKDTIEFLKSLQPIDPTYSKVTKLITSYQSKYFSNLSNESKEFVFQGLENAKTLFQKQKYDKAIKALKEILQADKKNKKAKKMLSQAIAQQEKIMTKEIENQIELKHQEMQPQAIKNKKLYARA